MTPERVADIGLAPETEFEAEAYGSTSI